MGKSKNNTNPKINLQILGSGKQHQSKLTTARKSKILEFYKGLYQNTYDEDGESIDLFNPIWQPMLKDHLNEPEISTQDITEWLKEHPCLIDSGFTTIKTTRAEVQLPVEKPLQVHEITSTVSTENPILKKNQYQAASDLAEDILDSMNNVPNMDRDHFYADAVAALKSIQKITARHSLLHMENSNHWDRVEDADGMISTTSL